MHKPAQPGHCHRNILLDLCELALHWHPLTTQPGKACDVLAATTWLFHSGANNERGQIGMRSRLHKGAKGLGVIPCTELRSTSQSILTVYALRTPARQELNHLERVVDDSRRIREALGPSAP
jgi:hypothetical protein